MSLPAWGVWIEMFSHIRWFLFSRSLPAWGVWIEINPSVIVFFKAFSSLPAWGVWIEI